MIHITRREKNTGKNMESNMNLLKFEIINYDKVTIYYESDSYT
jgi:hypothetical protein